MLGGDAVGDCTSLSRSSDMPGAKKFGFAFSKTIKKCSGPSGEPRRNGLEDREGSRTTVGVTRPTRARE